MNIARGSAANTVALVVDDEALMRAVITEVFLDTGITVLEAGSAGETMRLLTEHSDVDLHFWFIGKAQHRAFIVNVQFDSADDRTGEKLRPEECDFMIGKVPALVLKRLSETPNPALH